MALFDLPSYLNRFFYRFRPFSNRHSNRERLVLQQTQDMLLEYPKAKYAINYSRQKLQQIRNQRLRKLLIYAKYKSPWYPKSLAHIDVYNFTEERLNELPVINKMILMENWDAIVTDRKLSLARAEKHLARMSRDNDTLYLLDRYHVLSTSGSSGLRGGFVYDWNEWITFFLSIIRYPLYNQDRSQLLIDPTQKIKIAQVVVTNTVYAMYSFSKSFIFSNIEKSFFPITSPINQIIKSLNEFRPEALEGTPTTMHKLCLEAHAGRLKIQPRIINIGGESLYEPIRKLIKEVWPNVNIFNQFGSSEGLLGISCHANNNEMHLKDDLCILESVDQFNNPVCKGTLPQRHFVTNLYNYTLPLIRYEWSDRLLILDKTCECGVEHQLIAEPQGRPEFDFIYPGNIFVHHLLFVTPLLLEKNIREYQVIQTKEGATIKILTIGFVDKKQLQNYICNQLIKLGLSEPKVNVIRVPQFDYPPSGKLRRFIKLNTEHH
ncbi:phenylacetate--CoA ligase family protein [Fluoribacter gormanii]|uniref:phenylacetate--CoA ligase family protein n=1 Tax=Fluoribacter gormanii TaxID=464 RepID=UPI001041475A|nr:phenylacetate--CoA ligase family protein [Fluoribacter gormanii]